MSESFVKQLDQIVEQRLLSGGPGSYTRKLADAGVARVAQKVGEEAVETAIAAVNGGPELLEEAADLTFHLLILLRMSGYGWPDVERVLAERHRNNR